MALPKIELPLFELEVPSTGKKVKYRPFTVKEEKILLVAQEAKDIDQFILATTQIINNCVEGISVNDLAIFDLEYILMNILARSVAEDITFSITDPDTQEKVDLTFNINDVKVRFDPVHKKIIKIDESTHIVMKYPSFEQIKQLTRLRYDDDSAKEENSKVFIDIMVSCIDQIESNGAVYHMKDFSAQEINDFFESLPTTKVKDMETFFSTMPTLRHEVKYKNKKGDDKVFVIEGMESFFI